MSASYCPACGRPVVFYRLYPESKRTCTPVTKGDCLPWIGALARSLATDPEDERIVDELMAAAQAGKEGRKL